MKRTIEEAQAIRTARRVHVDPKVLRVARERDANKPPPPAPTPKTQGTATLTPTPDNPNKWGWTDQAGEFRTCPDYAVSRDGVRRFLNHMGWAVTN